MTADDDPGEWHPTVHVHGGSGRDDHEAWTEAGEATGTYPRTLEHAHPGLAALAPMWVAIMEPWPRSPGDDLTPAQQVALLWETGAPDGVDIHDTAAALTPERRTVIDRLVDKGPWNNLSDVTGWEDGPANEGDFTISLFGELGDGLLATFIGFNTAHGSVRHLSLLDQPERLMIAAVDDEDRPFVVRLTPGTGCPVADRLKLRILTEVITDQFTRLGGVDYVEVYEADEDEPEDHPGSGQIPRISRDDVGVGPLDTVHARIRGCLMAGAVGDALGAPVEFWSLAEIRRRLGPEGVTGFVGGHAQVTDDTQMTLFTAEGGIRASIRARAKGMCNLTSVVFNAYRRWLVTQHVGYEPEPDGPFDGWLLQEPGLHHQRAPGRTCIAAISASWRDGDLEAANDSKGCGGVMRVAPVGLVFPTPEGAFDLGCDTARTTHGHPSGYLPAGVLAAAIASLSKGASLPAALHLARGLLPEPDSQDPRTAETAAALDAAFALAESGPASPERIEQLGGGWVGEEALAIAVYCALSIPDPFQAILASVNHSGDSDSTGSICGNLLGAAHGTAAFPEHLFAQLDLADVITQMADDIWHEITVRPGDEGDEYDSPPDYWWDRYPGW